MITATGLLAASDNEIVRSALSKAVAPVGRVASKLGQSAIDRMVVALNLGFYDYVRTSYERCRYFKSILPPSQPRDILEHYQHVDLESGSKTIEDDELFDNLHSLKSVVITGLAGSGKSMLLRYIVSRYFIKPEGPIPLFVELRRLNAFTKKDILSYIRSDCVSAENQITDQQFSLALRGGVFCLVLDGFDEINHENREEIQSQIMDLRRLYPDLQIAITSRPDDRFSGWSQFHVYKVKPLNKEQCIDLINDFEYDSGVKRRFRNEVKTSLWDSHQSFLEYPLLASIMLLTYEEFAEIPRKKHVFYRQAFDTLFQKHDASKEQFQRKTKTGLQLEEFRSCFAAFCGFSYIKEIFSFDDDVLADFSAKAIKYTKNAGDIESNIDPNHFSSDLFEAVCMLQKDGVYTAFVHRSFQEYFAALFATKLSSDSLVKFLDHYALRFHDSSVSMAFDMSKEVVETEWVVNAISRIISALENPSVAPVERFSNVMSTIAFSKASGKPEVGMYTHGPLLSTIEIVARLYPSETKIRSVLTIGRKIDLESAREDLTGERNAGRPRIEEFRNLYAAGGDEKFVVFSQYKSDDQWWFEAIRGNQLLVDTIDALGKVKKSIQSRDRRASNIIDSML